MLSGPHPAATSAAPLAAGISPSYGPAAGYSALDERIGPRGYDGGVFNSPFSEGRVKEPFLAPGTFNPMMFGKPRRRRINLLGLFTAVCTPTIVFAMTAWLFCFWVRDIFPLFSWIWVGLVLLVSALFVLRFFLNRWKQDKEMWTVPWYLRSDDDTWYFFLACAFVAGVLLGIVWGDYVFGSFMQPYYTLSQLHSYKKVDPAATGTSYMDAGAIEFKDNSYVDTTMSIGYKDDHVWCAAPIKWSEDKVANLDFWAVGMDCCDGFPGNFNCLEHRDDFNAHGGLRIIDDASIPFYRVAVMQGNQEFDRTSRHPLFFTWMREPEKRVLMMWRNGRFYYIAGVVVFAVFEALAVLGMALRFWNHRLERGSDGWRHHPPEFLPRLMG